MFNLLSLPRASLKVRKVFFLWLVVSTSLMVEQWSHRHDDLAIARWIAWYFLVSGALYLPSLIVVVLFGRLPKIYQRMFNGLNRTLPQIHTDFFREQRKQREGSREL